ncbi:insulin protein enhancer protein ISL-1 isoform X1 [Vespula squamosa]|uniref:Insulin protein enhancer protein ISL-1 isoform X1 n=1 Tax=Vespula squamosa TaxID=30214 RepID=A0ABD2AA88_VESSQ
MQRAVAGGGPGPLGLQGPPRSVKISPVNIQDEPGDPTSQTGIILLVGDVKIENDKIRRYDFNELPEEGVTPNSRK